MRVLKKKLILLAVFGFVLSTGCGQTSAPSTTDTTNQGSVAGKVFDTNSYSLSTSSFSPLSGASVTIGDKAATTDTNGLF
jgi:hypothetical protein